MRVKTKDLGLVFGGLAAGTGLGVLFSWAHFKRKYEKEKEELIETFKEEAKRVEEAALKAAVGETNDENSDVSDVAHVAHSKSATCEEINELSPQEYQELYSNGKEVTKRVDNGGKIDYSAVSTGKFVVKNGVLKKIDPAESEFPTEDDDVEDDSYVAHSKSATCEDFEEMLQSDENFREGYWKTVEMNSKKKPKIISGDDFYNSYSDFEESHLTYYQGDGVLVEDEKEEELIGYESLIGNALDKYGFRTSDEQVIYVVNYQHQTKYEIAKCVGAFADEISNIGR